MSCSFKIEFPGLALEHIETARAAVVKHGGYFELNGKGGAFEIQTAIGKIDGSFIVKGNEVTFNIDRKPFILTCHRIEKEIRKYVGIE
jgi:hypothetical protein